MAFFPFFKKRYQPKSYYEDEPQPSWYVTHRPLVFIGVGIILMAVVAICITVYISKNTPVAKLSYALSKDIDSGCDFHIEAALNEEPQMTFDGSAKITGQEVTLTYDADYVDYTYQGVALTQEGMNYAGSYYQDQWHITEINSKVLDFMDFYVDLRHAYFDTGSLLRFLGVTEKYSSVEFGSLLSKVFPRFATENNLTHMQLTETSESATYSYQIDMEAFLSLLEEKSASAFFKSSDYEKFYEKIELNRNTLSRAKVQMSFEILKHGGYLDHIHLLLESDGQRYTLDVEFFNFSEPTHTVPESFYEAAAIHNPYASEVSLPAEHTVPPAQAPQTQAPATQAPASQAQDENSEEEEAEESNEDVSDEEEEEENE